MQTSQSQQHTQPNSLWEMFRFVFGNVLKKRWILILNIAALTIITLLQFVLPQIEQFIIDKVIPKQQFCLLFLSIGTLLLTAIVLGIFNFISTYYMGVMSKMPSPIYAMIYIVTF